MTCYCSCYLVLGAAEGKGLLALDEPHITTFAAYRKLSPQCGCAPRTPATAATVVTVATVLAVPTVVIAATASYTLGVIVAAAGGGVVVVAFLGRWRRRSCRAHRQLLLEWTAVEGI